MKPGNRSEQAFVRLTDVVGANSFGPLRVRQMRRDIDTRDKRTVGPFLPLPKRGF